jgi:hypothetical protein
MVPSELELQKAIQQTSLTLASLTLASLTLASLTLANTGQPYWLETGIARSVILISVCLPPASRPWPLRSLVISVDGSLWGTSFVFFLSQIRS